MKKEIKSLAYFRDWLSQGNDVNLFINESPLISKFISEGNFEIAFEAIACDANLNLRDGKGKGWLHWCIEANAPSSLSTIGLRKLDSSWWKPSKEGITPLHLPIADKKLAQAIISRWWTEQLSWSILSEPFDPLLSSLPQLKTYQNWQKSIRK